MLLVVAWDGACFEVVGDFLAAGDMPALAGLLARGRGWRVRSTVPPVTFPAWTTFMTGAGPARHGITDFAVRDPGTYRVRFVNSTYRRLPTIWALMAGAGRRVGVYAMPATYPAETACALQVCGFDTPLGASGAAGFCHPRELEEQLKSRYGSLAVEGVPQTRIGEGWHEKAAGRLLETIALRTRIVCDLLAARPFDVFAVHYIESDTVAHHFWQFDDPASPRARTGPRGVVRDVYRSLDAALAQLLAAAGDDASVLLVSDHGSGGSSDRVIFWNRWLAGRGWLAFDSDRGGRAARHLRRAALAVVPASLQARLFGSLPGAASRLESRARFAGIDWERTRAFSDELPYYPSLWLNVKGRDPRGTLAPADVEPALRDLEQEARQLRDPFDGSLVVKDVRRRQELFDGPFASLAPDLVFELNEPGGYSYCAGSSAGGAESRAIRRLSGREMQGSKGASTSGSHREFGMMVIADPACVAGAGTFDAAVPCRTPPAGVATPATRFPCCTIADAGVTALALAGVAPTAVMEGHCVIRGASVAADLAAGAAPAASHAPHGIEPVAYGADEEEEIRERLRLLGYLP